MAGRIMRILRRARGYFLFGRKAEIFGPFTVIRPKGVRLGSKCAINQGVFLHGGSGITIGDDVILSAGCMIMDFGLDPATFGDLENRRYGDQPIAIDDGAWIGAGAIILPGVRVGTMAIVGAGSVVTRDVPPFTIVAGNPARAIGAVEKKASPTGHSPL